MRIVIERTPLPKVSAILDAIGLRVIEFDWYISNFEGFPWPVELNNCWIDGIDVEKLLLDPDLSISWAVFSAVPRGERPSITLPPFADGNSELWSNNPPSVQMTGAAFEFVIWDASAVVLTGLSAPQVEKLSKIFS